MNRRRFIGFSGAGVVGSVFSARINNGVSISLQPQGDQTLKAKDILRFLRSLCEVSEPSVDRIIIGDPETKITKLGTAWLPYWKTCREAVRKGVNTLIVHEPVFFTHWDLDEKMSDYLGAPPAGKDTYLELRDRKMKWLEYEGLVIIRCHDVLQAKKAIAVADAIRLAGEDKFACLPQAGS